MSAMVGKRASRSNAFRIPLLAYLRVRPRERIFSFGTVAVGGKIGDRESGTLAVIVRHTLHQFDALRPRKGSAINKGISSMKYGSLDGMVGTSRPFGDKFSKPV